MEVDAWMGMGWESMGRGEREVGVKRRRRARDSGVWPYNIHPSTDEGKLVLALVIK